VAVTSPLAILPSMADDLTRVEHQLLAAVEAEDGFLTEISSHLILAGGKRVRPGFSIASASVLDASGSSADDDVILGGVAVELVHIGSLYHDDVMDDATTRRNVTSVNAEWGNLRAILAGDYLLGRASEIAAGLGTEVAGLLATTITHLCEGQILELETAFRVDRTEALYERSITGKTASLLSTACRIGAVVAGLPPATVESLTEFGAAYGMAFQVVDDILDVIATDEQLGKPAGNDLVEGIYTLPVIRSMAHPGVGEELRTLLGAPLDRAARDRARELVREGGGVDEALDVARTWADQAAGALTDLPETPGASALRAAADHLIERAATPR
jgi:heptaprenyl diphosphate synthase